MQTMCDAVAAALGLPFLYSVQDTTNTCTVQALCKNMRATFEASVYTMYRIYIARIIREKQQQQ